MNVTKFWEHLLIVVAICMVITIAATYVSFKLSDLFQGRKWKQRILVTPFALAALATFGFMFLYMSEACRIIYAYDFLSREGSSYQVEGQVSDGGWKIARNDGKKDVIFFHGNPSPQWLQSGGQFTSQDYIAYVRTEPRWQ